MVFLEQRPESCLERKGLHNTNGPNWATAPLLYVTCWKGRHWTILISSCFIPDDVNETVDNVNFALNIFPADAVMNMKQYLNLELSKPNKLSACEIDVLASNQQVVGRIFSFRRSGGN